MSHQQAHSMLRESGHEFKAPLPRTGTGGLNGAPAMGPLLGYARQLSWERAGNNHNVSKSRVDMVSQQHH
jgi:hypothetical protein